MYQHIFSHIKNGRYIKYADYEFKQSILSLKESLSACKSYTITDILFKYKFKSLNYINMIKDISKNWCIHIYFFTHY